MSSCFATASHHHYPAGNGHGLVLHPLVPVIAQPSLVVSNKFSNRGTSVKHIECSHNTTEASEKNLWSSSQVENNFEAIVPDGAIVVIQDANQRMYFTIDGEENSFEIGGVVRYSLAGERDLFRVKHCFQKGRHLQSKGLWSCLLQGYHSHKFFWGMFLIWTCCVLST